MAINTKLYDSNRANLVKTGVTSMQRGKIDQTMEALGNVPREFRIALDLEGRRSTYDMHAWHTREVVDDFASEAGGKPVVVPLREIAKGKNGERSNLRAGYARPPPCAGPDQDYRADEQNGERDPEAAPGMDRGRHGCFYSCRGPRHGSL